MRRFAGTLLAFFTAFAAPAQFDPGKILGGQNAPVVLEVFSSFDCSHCKILHDELMPKLVRDFVMPGKVAVVNREFPLTGQYHPYAREASEYATAAARIGKYPEVADALWKNQTTWAANGKVWETVANVLTAVDQKKVQALTKDPGVQAEIQRDVEAGIQGGINATPTIFLNAKGKRFSLPPGVPDYGLLTGVLKDSLK